MGVFHIKFDKENKATEAFIGGDHAFIEDSNDVPKIPGTTHPQKLLLTLTSDFFRFPLLKSNECVSVFVSNDSNAIPITRHLAINMQQQIGNLSNGYAKVFIHKKAANPVVLTHHFPHSYLGLVPFTSLELSEETQTPDAGTEYAKLNGLPGWLQLNEADLVKVSPEYDDVFRGRVGYLFLNRSMNNIQVSNAPVEIGHFFIRFT